MKQQENNFNYIPSIHWGVWEKTLPDFNREGLVNQIYKLRDIDLGTKISNKGGYHSSPFQKHPQFQPLIELINNHTNSLFKTSTINIQEIWANISTYTNYNIPHHHSPDNNPMKLSGILYLKTPKDGGNIQFIPPFNMAPPVIITPKELQILIFPSVLVHYVEPNLSQEDRISLAFNF